MSKFFLLFNDRVTGPYSARKILAGISEGKLAKDVQFSSNENGPWETISQFQTKSTSLDQSSVNLESLKQEFQEFRDSITTRISQIEEKLTEISNNAPASIPVETEADTMGVLSAEAESLSRSVPTFWKIDITNDPITDSQQILLTCAATEGVNAYGNAPELYIRFLNDCIDIWVFWGAYFTEGDHSVTHRIDSAQPINSHWRASTDGQGTFYHPKPEPLNSGWAGKVLQLFQALLKADSLVVRAEPYSAIPITAVFDTKGLENLIRTNTDSLNHLLV